MTYFTNPITIDSARKNKPIQRIVKNHDMPNAHEFSMTPMHTVRYLLIAGILPDNTECVTKYRLFAYTTNVLRRIIFKYYLSTIIELLPRIQKKIPT